MATDIYPTKPIADITEINDSHRLMAHYRAALRTSWRRLPTDQFEVLVKEEMETDTSMASRLITIVDGLPHVLANYQKQIPSTIFTLYDLTKLGEDVVEAKVKAGEITPDTTRAQVQDMLPKPKKRRKRRTKNTDVKPMQAPSGPGPGRGDVDREHRRRECAVSSASR